MKIGKKTKMAIKANQIIKKRFVELDIKFCEVKLSECFINYELHPAHRKKRIEYKAIDELTDMNEVLLCCNNCHIKIEGDRKLTEKVFERALKQRVNNFWQAL